MASSKADQMRQMREEQWRMQQEAQAKARRSEPSKSSASSGADDADAGVTSAPRPSAQPKRTRGRSGAGATPKRAAGSAATARADELAAEGACSGCGKVRALRGGLVVAHRKGLQAQCPGSRKPPV